MGGQRLFCSVEGNLTGEYVPFLMREDVATKLLLFALDKFDVREHAVGLVARSKFGWKREGKYGAI